MSPMGDGAKMNRQLFRRSQNLLAQLTVYIFRHRWTAQHKKVWI